MEKELIKITQDLGEVRTEMRYLIKGFNELSESHKLIAQLIERQNSMSERVKNLENSEIRTIKDLIEKNGEKIRRLEDWRLTIIAGAGVIGAIVSFILNKIF